MKYLLFLASAFCLLGMQTESSFAADIQAVRIIASANNSFARETAAQLADVLRRGDSGLHVEVSDIGSAGKPSDPGKRLLVAIGENAVAEIEAGGSDGSPVLALTPRRVSLAGLAKKYTLVTAIHFEQPLTRLLNLAKLIQVDERSGKADILGVVATSESQRYLATAESAAGERRQKLVVELAENERDVGRAIARVISEASVVLAIPDPVVHTPNTVQPILLLTYQAGIPVIGYSAAYLRAGAMVALYSTPAQLARQMAETIAAFRDGKSIPAHLMPRYFTVGVNATVARSLGMELPRAEILEEKLRSMKE